MAIQERDLADAFKPEASSLASAALASLTPRMITQFGSIAESAATAMDMLTSPEILSLLRKLQKAAPTLSALLDQIGGDGPGAGIDGVAEHLTAAVSAGKDEVRQHPQPLHFMELMQLRRDPAMGAALRFLVGFAHGIFTENRD